MKTSATLFLTTALTLVSFVGLDRPLHAAPPTLPNREQPVRRPTFPNASPGAGIITPTSATAVTWTGTASGVPPGQMGESGATPGGNEDTFKLTVTGLPSDWNGKIIPVKIDWTVPANDYDLYIHKANADGSDGVLVGTSAGGAPSTEEATSISPSVTGTGVYNVNVIYFTVTPGSDQFIGNASVQTGTANRTASYTHGGITFSPNSPLKAPTGQSANEPSSRVDTVGNCYVCGIRGVPAGVDLWYFDLRPTIPDPNNANATISNPNYDPFMRVPIYRGQPDQPGSTAQQAGLSAGALGGGDIDLAVGFGNYSGVDAGLAPVPTPVLAYASLTAANVTYGRSLDHAATFTFSPTGNLTGGVPVNDRQWMGFIGNNNVYLEYRNFAQGVAFVQQSTNGGLTYGPAILVGSLPQTGALDVDQFDGTVYISGNDGHVAVGTPVPPSTQPLTYTIQTAVPATANPANIFFPVRVAADNRNNAGTLVGNGTVYCCYSNGVGIFLVHSLDKGAHWSAPVQVNDPSDAAETTNLMPWLATGPTPGSVAVVWYGTPSANDINNDAAHRYRVYYAVSYNATSATPSFRIVQASDHTNHPANISLSGLVVTGTSPNRNLGDYFQVNFDTTGAAVIGYTDDHNDFAGFSFVTRQISGPTISGKGTVNVPTPVEGSALPAAPTTQPAQPGPNGEQVTDFAQDQDSGLLAVTPSNSPIDIVSILYTSQDSNQGPVITATMTVSDLTTVPPSSTWTMYFAANAPETGIVNIAGNAYSKGLADRGDYFYVRAATGSDGTRSYTWGTVARDVSGNLNTTQVGTADRGFFNSQNRTISVRLSSSKLNTYLQSIGHPTVGFGTTFCGLKGQTAGTVSGLALEDLTHGGTEFTIQNPF